MNTPDWMKPGLYGAAIGAVAVSFVGFSFAGWMTGGTAEQMAAQRSNMEVVAALVPICLQQSSQDPNVAATLKNMKESSSWDRSGMVAKAGWATMPGSTDPNLNVASACVDKLSENF